MVSGLAALLLASLLYCHVIAAAEMTIATDSTSNAPQTQIIQDGIMPPSSDETVLIRANRVYLWAISLAAICGAVSVGATAFIINYSDRVGKAQAEQIRQLERDRDVARAETAKAVLATEELRKETSWRMLSQDQANAITKEVKGKRSKLTIIYPSGDPEAAGLAAQFHSVFKQTSINTGHVEPRFGMGRFGVSLLYPRATNDKELVAAFSNIRVETQQGEVPNCTLVVGSKPPPYVKPE